MKQAAQSSERLPTMAELNPLLAPYQKANWRQPLLQLANTLIPYIALWYLMIRSLEVSYALTLALAVVAAGFMIRLFIFFHDCGHNSFFPSKRVNKIVGGLLGVLVFTPGEQWWHSHALHHATSGNLDKRGRGDVTTLTVEEWVESQWFWKTGYRFFRFPLVMFGLGPIFMFLISHRLPLPLYGKKQTLSVVWTNLGVIAIGALVSLLAGFKAYLMVQLPVLWFAGFIGIFLFYIQHQFEDTYWERNEKWNYVASALLGASFFNLPKLLRWFTGNIGYHHIHHLSPRIPNYFLDKCHEASPVIRHWARVVSIKDSLRAVGLKLWDEPAKEMVGFGDAEAQVERESGRVRKAME